MNTAAAATVALALIAADPEPNVQTWIYDNQIKMVFNQKIDSHQVEVIDANGCKVSQRSEISGDSRLIVHMKACERMGYPGGHMIVRYKVNGAAGEYHLHIRHHH